MENNQVHSAKFIGVCKVDGGAYQDVSITGAGHVSGDINCTSLHVAGSMQADGSIQTSHLKISGSAHIAGSVSASEVTVSGSGHFGAKLKAQKINANGSIHVAEDIECEALTTNGAFSVGGLINADSFKATLNGNCSADEIGGEEVVIKRRSNAANIAFFGVSISFNGGPGHLDVHTIEANNILLENTAADTVRGGVVEIGPGCDIKHVEYSTSITISPDAHVAEQIKVD